MDGARLKGSGDLTSETSLPLQFQSLNKLERTKICLAPVHYSIPSFLWLSPGNGGASQISILDAQLARSEGNCTRVREDEDALTGLGPGACLERGGGSLLGVNGKPSERQNLATC